MAELLLVNRQKVGYYRKKPFLVQAVQFTLTNRNEVFHFVGAANPAATFDERAQPALYMQTGHGPVMVRLGDWVIKMEEGDFYILGEAHFFANYDTV